MRDKRPYVKPVTRIELNTSDEKRRWIIAGVCLVIGILAIGYGFFQALSVQPGWEEVTVRSQEAHCGADFKFQYDFSEAGGKATSINTAMTKVYSDAAVRAHDLFSSDVEKPGLWNMAYLNSHVNETVAVDEALHKALSQVATSQSRQLFLAPAWAEYDRVFLCENDVEAALYDPAQNADVKAWLGELSVFVSDPNHISLEILEDNQVKLVVSQPYLDFASEYGIEVFADFGWMRNAFAADLMAEALVAAGYTKGYLASFDGFTRNLDASGTQYAQNVFARQDSDIYLPARMHYSAPMSMAALRNYPISDRDRWSYYGFEDGSIVTTFLDPRDGMSKSAVSDLLVYSQEKSCGELALAAAETFITGAAWEETNAFAIWPEGNVLYHTGPNVNLELLTDSGPGYSLKQK